MYPAPFEYMAPGSVRETVELLEQYGEDAKVLAGGQSLIPMMHLRLLAPRYVIDINGLENGEPRLHRGSLIVPALTRQRNIERSPLFKEHGPLISDAVRFIGNPRVRSRGTVGGNLAHADPSSEIGVSCLASKASITAVGQRGSRTIPLEQLFVTYLTTSLEEGELITELRVPAMEANTGWAFLEMARRAGEFAIVNVAALLSLDRLRRACTGLSVVLGGVSDSPVDISQGVSEVLVGEVPDERAFAAAGDRAAKLVDPSTDVHASAEYRKDLVAVYVRRALQLAHRRVTEGNRQA